MKDRMEDLEYSRRNFLKFSGILETKDENCDQIILNAVNKLILVDEKKKINARRKKTRILRASGTSSSAL